MPKVPRVDPTLNQMTNQSPNVMQRDIGSFGKIVSGVGETVSEYGEMFRKASLVAEKTRAQNQRDERLLDIYDRAEKDPDFSEKKRQAYDDEISKAIGDASQHITLPEERGMFSLESESLANVSKKKIDGVFWTKMVNQAKADNDIYLTNKKDQFIKARSFGEKQMAVVERNQKILEMVDSGFLTPAEGTTLKEKQDKDWAVSQVEYDIATNPELAKEMLDSKDYEGITEEERVKLLNDAQSAINRNSAIAERQQKQARDAAQNELTEKFFQGTLTMQELQDSIPTTGDDFARVMRKALLSPQQVTPMTKAETFNSLQNAFVDLEISEDETTNATLDELSNFRTSVMEAMGNGSLTLGAGQYFLRETSLAYKNKKAQGEPWYKGIWKAISSWADRNVEAEAAEETKTELQLSVANKVAEGKEPDEAYRETQSEYFEKINEQFRNYKVGDIFTSVWGVTYKVTGHNERGDPIVGPPDASGQKKDKKK